MCNKKKEKFFLESKNTNDQNNTIGFFALRIQSLIEKPEENSKIKKLEKFLAIIFKQSIEKSLKKNKEEYPFLEEKYFEKNENIKENVDGNVEKILSSKFEDKFSRYFSMHKKYFLNR